MGKKGWNVSIIVALIGLVATIAAAIIGVKWGKSSVTVIVQIDGKNVVLNDEDIEKMAIENEQLKNEILYYQKELKIQEDTKEKIEIVEEYYYIKGRDRAIYFLVIKNISDKSLSVDASVIARDGNSNILGAENDSIKIITPNQEMVMRFYFDDAGTAENFEYTINEEESERCESCIYDITWDVSMNKDKLIVLITNKGENDIEHVNLHALFFNDVEIFGDDYTRNVEVKSGNTVPVQLKCFEGEFEDFLLYVSAWNYK